MNCYVCRGKGILAYHRPAVSADEKIHMVLVLQRCYCEAGQILFSRSGSNNGKKMNSRSDKTSGGSSQDPGCP